MSEIAVPGNGFVLAPASVQEVTNQTIEERLQHIESLLADSHREPASSSAVAKEDRLTMLVFSGELDRLLAAFVLATGAAACGTRVSMFFAFWATAALKKAGPQSRGKTVIERMFGWMLPGGLGHRKLSHLDMLGAGRWLMCREMQKKNIASLPDLITLADELGVEISMCEMSMSLMGIREEELIDYSHRSLCGVAGFLENAGRSQTSLFI